MIVRNKDKIATRTYSNKKSNDKHQLATKQTQKHAYTFPVSFFAAEPIQAYKQTTQTHSKQSHKSKTPFVLLRTRPQSNCQHFPPLHIHQVNCSRQLTHKHTISNKLHHIQSNVVRPPHSTVITLQKKLSQSHAILPN